MDDLSKEGRPQRGMFIELFSILLDRYEEKELDDFYIEDKKGWEKIIIAFRPKEEVRIDWES